MAAEKALPGEVIDGPLGAQLPATKTSTLFKIGGLEVIRLVMETGKELKEHSTPGELVVHCLEGRIAFTALGKTQELHAGQLLYLAAGEPHAVSCIEAASVLLTVVKSERSH
jgi:quercetin dioxygenase-like cupin family protein